MKKVMVFGTFDVLHPGHIDFFKQAKEKGDYLIAVVARDVTVKKIKGKTPKHNEHQRLLNVYNVPEVALAMLGNKTNYYKVIEEQKPDVICIGYDQESFTENLKEELKKISVSSEILKMKPYKENEFKSSKIRNS